MQRIRFSLIYTFFLTCSLKKKKTLYTNTVKLCQFNNRIYCSGSQKKKKKKNLFLWHLIIINILREVKMWLYCLVGFWPFSLLEVSRLSKTKQQTKTKMVSTHIIARRVRTKYFLDKTFWTEITTSVYNVNSKTELCILCV